MASVNRFFVSGKFQHAEEKQVGALRIVEMSIVFDEQKKGGAVQKSPLKISCFGNEAKTASNLQTGTPLVVEGKISVREYQKDGQTKSFTGFLADRIQAFGAQPQQQGGVDDDFSVPF